LTLRDLERFRSSSEADALLTASIDRLQPVADQPAPASAL
jgi:hypothetical protein